MYSYTVRVATRIEASLILSEPQIASKLAKSVSQILASGKVYWLLEYSNYQLLVSLTSTEEEGVVDAHIACPKSSILASRILTLLAMEWIARTVDASTKELITTVPNTKMANFARKVGWVQYTPYTKEAVDSKLLHFKFTLPSKAI